MNIQLYSRAEENNLKFHKLSFHGRISTRTLGNLPHSGITMHLLHLSCLTATNDRERMPYWQDKEHS